MVKNILLNSQKKMVALAAIFFCSIASNASTDSTLNIFSFGFDGSRVFNQLFRANPYSSLLYLEYQSSLKYFVRVAGDIKQMSGEDGSFDYQTKVGLKRIIKKHNSWLFYLGLDAIFEREFNRNSQVKLFTEGGLFYLGATFKIGEHFSLSTEPTFYWIFSQKRDLDSFDKSISYSQEQSLTSIGLVRASFHF
jgi:hypothetical protein